MAFLDFFFPILLISLYFYFCYLLIFKIKSTDGIDLARNYSELKRRK